MNVICPTLKIKFGLKLDKQLDKFKELYPLCIEFKHEFKQSSDYNIIMEQSNKSISLLGNVILFEYSIDHTDDENILTFGYLLQKKLLEYNQYFEESNDDRVRKHLPTDVLRYSDVIFHLMNKELFIKEIPESLEELWTMAKDAYKNDPRQIVALNAELLNKKRVKEIKMEKKYYQ